MNKALIELLNRAENALCEHQVSNTGDYSSTTKEYRDSVRAEIVAFLLATPAPIPDAEEVVEPWTSIDSGDLDSAERFIKTQHGNAAFFYKDAQTLANISLHCIREVRAVRALQASAMVEPDGSVCVPVEVLRLYEFMAASFTPFFTSQHEQIAISLRKAKAAMIAASTAPGDSQ